MAAVHENLVIPDLGMPTVRRLDLLDRASDVIQEVVMTLEAESGGSVSLDEVIDLSNDRLHWPVGELGTAVAHGEMSGKYTVRHSDMVISARQAAHGLGSQAR